MSLIRGVVLAGKFRTQHELNGMSNDDQRNTLIVELAGRTNQSVGHFQAMDDATLAGTGAVLVFLRETKIRTDQELKSMSDDDQRNTLIVELGAQTNRPIPVLQGLSNMDLVLQALGHGEPSVSLIQPSYIRGVVLAGKFRTQHELNGMSNDDQRNTLIVELAGRTNQSVGHFQAMNDFTLAGTGAVLVFLRETKIRTDQELKSMSDDDQRNTLIVELGAQTNRPIPVLQGLRNMDLVLLGLGVDSVFKPLPGPLRPPPVRFVFNVDSVEVQKQKADNDHSDSDWLSIIVTVANPISKSAQTFSTKPLHLEGRMKTGDIIKGPFVSDPIDPQDSDIVVINYLITNLGSTNAEEQFAQAVKITDKVVGVVGPIAGAVIGFVVAGDPAEGLKIGQEIAKGFDTAISTLGDVFDFLGIHFAPPNCNGEVLHDTLTYQPNELGGAVDIASSREYTGPQGNDRCGSPPKTKVNFSIHQVPFTG